MAGTPEDQDREASEQDRPHEDPPCNGLWVHLPGRKIVGTTEHVSQYGSSELQVLILEKLLRGPLSSNPDYEPPSQPARSD